MTSAPPSMNALRFSARIPLGRGLVIFGVIGSAFVHAASPTITLKARLSHVTAFDDGAVVSFGGAVNLETGTTVVRFTDLPRGFKAQNARITGYGKASVMLLEADTEVGSRRDSRRLRLVCEVSRGGEFDFTVAYRDDQVFWAPNYVMRIDTAVKKLSLEYAAIVRQTTRDSWRNVSLTILPHRMGRGGGLPQQDPWRLALAAQPEPEPEHEGMQDEWFSLTDDELFYDVPWGFKEPEEVSLRHAETAKAYRRSVMPGGGFWGTSEKQEVSLPANSRAQRVVFATKTFDCTLCLVTWPKLARCVYRTVEMRNNSYLPLAAGDVEVYIDGDKFGRLSIDDVKPGESLVLNLGVDHKFVVERSLERDFGSPHVESLGNPPTHHRMTHAAITTIENRHATRQVVEVRDQIPRSTDPTIAVELLPWDSFDMAAANGSERTEPMVAADGTMTWLLTLSPGQRLTLPVKIAVTWPVGQHLLPWRFW